MRQTLRGLLSVVSMATLASTGEAQFGPEGRYRPETVSANIERAHGKFAKGNLDYSYDRHEIGSR